MNKIKLTKENYEKLISGNYLLLTNTNVYSETIIEVDETDTALITNPKTMFFVNGKKPINNMVDIKDNYVSEIGFRDGKEYNEYHYFTKINKLYLLVKIGV